MSVKENTEYDQMAAVFDAISADQPTAPPADEPAAVKPEATPEPTPEAAAEAEPEVEPEATPEKPDVDWEARFKELEAKLTAKSEPPRAAAPPPETPPPDIYSADEKALLEAYRKDWPDVVKGAALERRGEYRELIDYVFKEVARVYGPLVERGAQAAESVEANATLAEIYRHHADYDDKMYAEVVGWADTLSGTRQRVAKEVIKSGDPSEVVDLISEFKSATGRSKPRVVAGTAVPAAKKQELSPAAKQAAKALGVVDSKRSASSPGSDVTDFDAAWREAIQS